MNTEARVNGQAPHETDGDPGRTSSGGSGLDDLHGDVAAIASSVRRIAIVRWFGLKLAIRRGVLRVAMRAWVALVVVVATIAATIHLVGGVVAGITALSGQGWIGGLAGGLAILGFLLVAAWIVHAVRSRRRVEKLEAHLRRADRHRHGADRHGADRHEADRHGADRHGAVRS